MTRQFLFLMLICLTLGLQAHAAETSPIATAGQQAPSPRDVVVQAVNRMTKDIQAHHDQLVKNPAYASSLVAQELDGLVDFKRITRLVMGKWFSQASRAQKYHFLDVFKQSLIDTYASGVTLYQGQKIDVLPLRDGDVRGDRAFVRMQLTTQNGTLVPVSYTMINNQGRWQVENVIVNGLNLGKTFQEQFAQSAEQYQGNLDAVIGHWAAQLKANQTPSTGSAKTPK
jgi:phospholipid transport system substrate-binding protein